MRAASCVMGLLVVWGQATAFGQDEHTADGPQAVTDVRLAGPEFQMQGEYVGLISGGYRRAPVGLQVAYRGDGKFEALEYAGGLPGAGWNHSEQLSAAGERLGTMSAQLKGDKRELLLVHGRLHVRDEDGILRAMVQRTERSSPTLGLAAPAGAIVLFDGRSTDELEGERITDDGLLMEGALTKRSFEDFTLHAEFRLPFMPTSSGQGRGNSGIYIQQRYEVQILDSFGLEPQFNDCGALYRQRPPAMNMCLPPLVWQTYDINFRAARYNDAGDKVANARITVRLNGVMIHDDVELTTKTGAGRPEGPDPRPIMFQDHRDPVRFRNIWIVQRGAATPRSEMRMAGMPWRDEPVATGMLPGGDLLAAWQRPLEPAGAHLMVREVFPSAR